MVAMYMCRWLRPEMGPAAIVPFPEEVPAVREGCMPLW
jgi:hypothetical protein